jgi:C-terminal processing protease CtpA/Prc
VRFLALVGFLTACSAPARPTPTQPTVPLPAPTPAPAPVAEADRVPFGPDDRAAELAQLRDALKDTYAHLETKKTQWGVDPDMLYAKYESRIKAADTWAKYEIVMVAFVSEFHDGHVSWRRARGAKESKRKRARVGVDTAFVGEMLTVTNVWPNSGAQTAGLAVGDRIIAVDDRSIDQRLGELSTIRVWSRAEDARYDFAEGWAVEHYPADGQPKPRRITRERDDGSYETLTVAPETKSPGGDDKPIEVQWRGDIAILHVRDLAGHVKDVVATAKQVSGEIYAKSKGLVVDLRDNGGGYEDGARAVAAHFTAKHVVGANTRVRLSKQARETPAWKKLAEDPGKAGWSTLQPLQFDGVAAKEYPGKIAVVIDAGCRSSCETLALLLRAMGARLYGERTGGTSGAPITVTLPKSGAKVGIPARAAYDLDGQALEGRGVGPDELVPLTRADVLGRRDARLDRAVDHVCPAGAGKC